MSACVILNQSFLRLLRNYWIHPNEKCEDDILKSEGDNKKLHEITKMKKMEEDTTDWSYTALPTLGKVQ